TSPDEAIAYLAGEGVQLPVRLVGRHDVKVAVDEQAGPRPVRALDPRHDAGPLRMRLEDHGREPDLGEQPRDVLRGHPLPGPGVIPRVRGVDPDQRAAQVRDLILGKGGSVVGHTYIVPPSRPFPPPAHSHPPPTPTPLPFLPSGGVFAAGWP